MFDLLDIDECQKSDHGYSQDCVNTEGSFTCVCGSGYELHRNGRNCTGKRLIVFLFCIHTSYIINRTSTSMQFDSISRISQLQNLCAKILLII